MAVCALAQRRKLAMGKKAIHIHGLPGRACPRMFIAELRQGHPLHRFLPGAPCSLCVPGASGPQDCGLVYLVISDPDLRERLHQIRTVSV